MLIFSTSYQSHKNKFEQEQQEQQQQEQHRQIVVGIFFDHAE